MIPRVKQNKHTTTQTVCGASNEQQGNSGLKSSQPYQTNQKNGINHQT